MISRGLNDILIDFKFSNMDLILIEFAQTRKVRLEAPLTVCQSTLVLLVHYGILTSYLCC